MNAPRRDEYVRKPQADDLVARGAVVDQFEIGADQRNGAGGRLLGIVRAGDDGTCQRGNCDEQPRGVQRAVGVRYAHKEGVHAAIGRGRHAAEAAIRGDGQPCGPIHFVESERAAAGRIGGERAAVRLALWRVRLVQRGRAKLRRRSAIDGRDLRVGQRGTEEAEIVEAPVEERVGGKTALPR